VSGFTVILPGLVQGHIIPESSSVWPASMFSLAVASTTLVFGRLADMYGGRRIYICGAVWLAVWSLVIGFARNEVLLDLSRAFQGIGASAMLPSGLMMMGRIYRPGRRKNIVFSIYGACAPFGFFIGILVGGISGGSATWGYYFWVGAALTVFTSIVAYFTVPGCSDPAIQTMRREVQSEAQYSEQNNDGYKQQEDDIVMDWVGGGTLFLCLNFLIVALVASSQAPNGWKTPYVYICFILGISFFLATICVERWIAKCPLIPLSFLCKPQMPALLLSLFLFYGSLSVYLLHASQYMEQSMGASTIQTVAWYAPMAAGGCVISIFGGYVLHLLPGTILLIIAGSAWVIAPLLFAIAPSGANYWEYIFPSMLCATIGIDITFNVCNIYITTSTPYNQQGFAGAIIAFLLHFGGTVCLAMAGVVKQKTQSSLGERKSCQAVFWMEVGCATMATIILVAFVRIGEAKSEIAGGKKNLEQNTTLEKSLEHGSKLQDG
jgi:predicted MFS family arabinose efflux permease